MHRRSPSRFLALLVLVLTLPACGIVFSADFDGTEVFREFELESASEVDGEFLAESPITVTVTLNQAYPVPIAISCGFEDVDITDDQRKVAFNERAITVFETTLPANPGQQPSKNGESADEVVSFDFPAPQPGDYFIACFTPAAPENGIGRGFTVIEP